MNTKKDGSTHMRFAYPRGIRMSLVRIRLSLVLAALATAALYGASTHAMPMNTRSPEHVADAFAALKAGRLSAAKDDLTKAIATSAEPKMARMHAQEALATLAQHKIATARMHAENGAAVEHFTYALRALDQATQRAIARARLREALSLPMYKKFALVALAALAKREFAIARAETRRGLHAAEVAA